MRHALALACTLALLHGLTAQAATDSCVANPDIDQAELDALAARARQGDLCSSLAVARYADSGERYMSARFYYLLAASQGDTSSDQRLLELYREQVVAFEQVTPLGDLTIRWMGDDDAQVEVTDEFDVEREVDREPTGESELDREPTGESDGSAVDGAADDVEVKGSRDE